MFVLLLLFLCCFCHFLLLDAGFSGCVLFFRLFVLHLLPLLRFTVVCGVAAVFALLLLLRVFQRSKMFVLLLLLFVLLFLMFVLLPLLLSLSFVVFAGGWCCLCCCLNNLLLVWLVVCAFSVVVPVLFFFFYFCSYCCFCCFAFSVLCAASASLCCFPCCLSCFCCRFWVDRWENHTLAAFDLPKCLYCFCCFFCAVCHFLLLLDAGFSCLCAVYPVVRVAFAAIFVVCCCCFLLLLLSLLLLLLLLLSPLKNQSLAGFDLPTCLYCFSRCLCCFCCCLYNLLLLVRVVVCAFPVVCPAFGSPTVEKPTLAAFDLPKCQEQFFLKLMRAPRKSQSPFVVKFTGISKKASKTPPK